MFSKTNQVTDSNLTNPSMNINDISILLKEKGFQTHPLQTITFNQALIEKIDFSNNRFVCSVYKNTSLIYFLVFPNTDKDLEEIISYLVKKNIEVKINDITKELIIEVKPENSENINSFITDFINVITERF